VRERRSASRVINAGTDLEGSIRTADRRTLVAVKIGDDGVIENIDGSSRFKASTSPFVGHMDLSVCRLGVGALRHAAFFTCRRN